MDESLQNDDIPWGTRGEDASAAETVTDTRLAARSLEERWPLTSEQRREIIGRLMAVVRDPGSPTRAVIAASRALMHADKVNVSSDVASKMPDRSQEEANDEYERACRILDRLATVGTDQTCPQTDANGRGCDESGTTAETPESDAQDARRDFGGRGPL